MMTQIQLFYLPMVEDNFKYFGILAGAAEAMEE
jgi:hypothetical protein